MKSQSNVPGGSPLSVIERLMEEEREAAELDLLSMAYVEDPTLRLLILKLAEIHTRSHAELERRLQEIKSQLDVTRQINDMFL